MRLLQGVAFLFVLASPVLAAETPRDTQVSVERLDAIGELLKAGRYAEAEGAARALLGQVSRSGQAETAETARVIHLLVEAMWRGGKAKDPEARVLAEKAVEINERSYGRQSAETAESLSVLGRVFVMTGDYPAARSIFDEVLKIREKIYAPDDLAVSKSLSNLSSVLRLMGDYATARPLMEQALAIAEKKLNPDDPELADLLGNMGAIDHDMGDLENARQLYERALEIYEKALGPNHIKVAKSLNDFANLLADTGDNEGAKPLYERALDISQGVLGPEHPDTANYLNNLAIVLQDMGDYARVRPLYEQALAVYEKSLGPNHPKVGLALTNLGSLVYDLGDYSAARPLLARALAIREKSLGPDHVDVASSLSNLAGDLVMLGDLKKARRLMNRAISIKEKSLDPDSPSLAYSVYDLAILLRRMGEYVAAEQAAQRTLSIWEKSLGPGHPLVAEALGSLAEIRVSTGDFQGAKELMERSMAIVEKALGPSHPKVAEGLEQIAALQWATGEPDAALENSLKGEAINRESFHRTASSLSEREALGYESVRESGLDIAFSAIVGGEPPSGSLARAWDETIRSRAIVLDEMARRHREATESDDPEVAVLASRLRSARNQLARMVVSGAQQESAEVYRNDLTAAQVEEEAAERDLAGKSVAFRGTEAKNSVGLAEVARSLPPDSALVAYVMYGRLASTVELKKRPSAILDRVPSYVALVLSPGGAEPRLVILGPARQIDSRIRAWRDEVSAAARGLALAGDRREIKYRQAGEALRKAVWDPLSRHLQGAHRVFVVPDGALNLVSLATLPVGGDRYLVETEPLIHYLSAERDLVRDGKVHAPGQGLLVLGGPDFDADPHASASVVESGPAVPGTIPGLAPGSPPVPGGGKELFRGRRAACAEFRSLRFQPLPASRVEAEAIGALWKSRVAAEEKSSVVEMIGPQAAEAGFKKRVAGHRIVHLATHGFFVDDRCSSALDRSNQVEGEGRRSDKGEKRDADDNPLLLTGLALAGANRREGVVDGEDGILTAEEISTLNLSGVEWAVLSACETGLGRVLAGEGVLGLRRAFEVAGAATLIMSLWSVEDTSALEWMERLYQGRLEGLSTDVAVREASLRMIESRRKAGRSAHPFYWGAFVAVGDWK